MKVRFTLLDDGSVHSQGDIVCDLESHTDHVRKYAVEVSLDCIDENYHGVMNDKFLGFEYVLTLGDVTTTGVLSEEPETRFGQSQEGRVRFDL